MTNKETNAKADMIKRIKTLEEANSGFQSGFQMYTEMLSERDNRLTFMSYQLFIINKILKQEIEGYEEKFKQEIEVLRKENEREENPDKKDS